MEKELNKRLNIENYGSDSSNLEEIKMTEGNYSDGSNKDISALEDIKMIEGNYSDGSNKDISAPA